jgi:hypothetical protein
MTAGKVKIENNLVTPLAAGIVTLTASQSGNGNFAAISSSQTFCIIPSKPTLEKVGITSPFLSQAV